MFGRKRTMFLMVNVLASLVFALTACSQAAPVPSLPAQVNAPATPPPAQPANAPASLAIQPVTAAVAGQKNAFGVVLPPDAAPPDQQYLRILSSEGATNDFAVSASKRCSSCDILSTPLVRVDKNFQLVPAGALSWDVSADGRAWTFHLDPALKWSDGSPVTADDVVFTFQYQADPKHAWDYASFWSDIQNWNDAVAGRTPASAIGVKAVDPLTVQFTTTAPSPDFLSKAMYIRPLSKVAFDKYGPNYDNDPKTSVSSSPWILEAWTKGQQMVFGPNKNYTGKLKPFLERLIVVFGDPSTEFQGYLNNQIDFAQTFSTADAALIASDAQLNSQYHPGYGDFRTVYLGFDALDKPFNDPKVRQAFAKAIDRDSLIKNIIGRQGTAAYSPLMAGFPDSTETRLKNEDVNQFDRAAAQKLLSDAGYPNGKGFPYTQLWLRNDESLMNQAVGKAVVEMLKQNLGVPVQLYLTDVTTFTNNLNRHRLPFYMASDGASYLDPSSLLGRWVSGGQHPWKNDPFDQLVNSAATLTGNPNRRDQMYKDADRILVDDVGGVFLYHPAPGAVYKTYVKGADLQPDQNGVAAWHWPGLEDMGTLMSTIYISNDVTDYHR